jgi:hypothetical protein
VFAQVFAWFGYPERSHLTGIRAWLNGTGLALLIALACITPLFLGWFAVTQEEAPAHFSSLYGLVPFYPGQNRILALLQFIASPARTVQSTIWIQYAAIVLVWSVGLAAFLIRYAPRVVGISLPLFFALIAFAFLPFYALLFSPTMPYVMPLGLALMAMSTVRPATDRLSTKLLFVAGCPLIVIATGINPTSTVIAGTFSLALVGGSLVTDRRVFGGAWKRVSSIVAEAWPCILFGILSALSVIAWAYLQDKFAQSYPQSAMSNYSVASYFKLAISFASIAQGYGYFADMVLSRSANPWLGPLLHCVILGTAPFGATVLWIAVRNDRFVQESLAAASLYIAAMLASVVTALNSHVMLVDNLIRGRYFIACFVVIVLAFVIFVGVSIALALQAQNLKRLCQAGLVVFSILVLGGSSWALTANPHFHANVLPASPDAVNAAKAIRSRKAIAVIGDYWIVWPLHLLVNSGEGHTPDTIPVTVRTEALPLRTFRLWERSLIMRDSMEVACVRRLPYGGHLDGTPPGDCQEKMNFNIDRGAFPKGRLVTKGTETFGALEVTYFELSRSGVSGPVTCTADDIVFRAAVRQKHDGGSATYLLRDGGFVLAGLPRPPGTRWWLAFRKTGTAEPSAQTLSLLPGGFAQFSLGSARFSVRADECRIMVDKDTGPLMSHDATEVVIARQ